MGQQSMMQLIQKFASLNPELHYFRDSSTGDHENGPYLEADAFLALQRQAAALLNSDQEILNASK
jgi:hypothetical protein